MATNNETKFPPEVDGIMLNESDLPKNAEPLTLGHLPIDFLLLTVKDCEFEACLSIMENYSKAYEISLGFLYVGNLRASDGKMKIAVMKCKMGAAGPGGALGVVRDAVKALTPKAVFCVGYCGGLNRAKVKLGDVVISETLITYAPSKVTEDGIQERGDRVPLQPKIANIILHVALDWRAPLKDSNEAKEVVIQRGALLSGPQVVDNNELREALIKRFPTAIAIEMEGEGVYASAHDLGVDWIVIKGVSDFADGKKSETNDWRPFASRMAASVVAHILSDTFVYEKWPHYNNGRTSLELPRTPDSGKEEKKTRREGSEEKLPPVKPGIVPNDDLQRLSKKLANKWKNLGRRLFSDDEDCEARLTGHDDPQHGVLANKAYAMLMDWKQTKGSHATFKVLYDALCDEYVNLRLIAERMCLREEAFTKTD